MKNQIVIILLFLVHAAHGQNIHVTHSAFSTYRHGPDQQVIDSTFAIVNAVFNSPEFRDSLTKSQVIFRNPDNNCECNHDVVMVNNQIAGNDVYKHLLKSLNPAIDIRLKRGRDGGKLGDTPICTRHITSFVNNVHGDMKKIPLAAALAVNICHEYFHSLGYCHTYNRLTEPDKTANGDSINWKVYHEDVTYRIGWIAYDILNRWINVEHRSYPYSR